MKWPWKKKRQTQNLSASSNDDKHQQSSSTEVVEGIIDQQQLDWDGEEIEVISRQNVIREGQQDVPDSHSNKSNTVDRWEVKDVCEWIKEEVGLQHCAYMCHKHKINGQHLQKLTREELEQMRIPTADIDTLLTAIRRLAIGLPASTDSPSTTLVNPLFDSNQHDNQQKNITSQTASSQQSPHQGLDFYSSSETDQDTKSDKDTFNLVQSLSTTAGFPVVIPQSPMSAPRRNSIDPYSSSESASQNGDESSTVPASILSVSKGKQEGDSQRSSMSSKSSRSRRSSRRSSGSDWKRPPNRHSFRQARRSLIETSPIDDDDDAIASIVSRHHSLISNSNSRPGSKQFSRPSSIARTASAATVQSTHGDDNSTKLEAFIDEAARHTSYFKGTLTFEEAKQVLFSNVQRFVAYIESDSILNDDMKLMILVTSRSSSGQLKKLQVDISDEGRGKVNKYSGSCLSMLILRMASLDAISLIMDDVMSVYPFLLCPFFNMVPSNGFPNLQFHVSDANPLSFQLIMSTKRFTMLFDEDSRQWTIVEFPDLSFQSLGHALKSLVFEPHSSFLQLEGLRDMCRQYQNHQGSNRGSYGPYSLEEMVSYVDAKLDEIRKSHSIPDIPSTTLNSENEFADGEMSDAQSVLSRPSSSIVLPQIPLVRTPDTESRHSFGSHYSAASSLSTAISSTSSHAHMWGWCMLEVPPAVVKRELMNKPSGFWALCGTPYVLEDSQRCTKTSLSLCYSCTTGVDEETIIIKMNKILKSTEVSLQKSPGAVFSSLHELLTHYQSDPGPLRCRLAIFHSSLQQIKYLAGCSDSWWFQYGSSKNSIMQVLNKAPIGAFCIRHSESMHRKYVLTFNDTVHGIMNRLIHPIETETSSVFVMEGLPLQFSTLQELVHFLVSSSSVPLTSTHQPLILPDKWRSLQFQTNTEVLQTEHQVSHLLHQQQEKSPLHRQLTTRAARRLLMHRNRSSAYEGITLGSPAPPPIRQPKTFGYEHTYHQHQQHHQEMHQLHSQVIHSGQPSIEALLDPHVRRQSRIPALNFIDEHSEQQSWFCIGVPKHQSLDRIEPLNGSFVVRDSREHFATLTMYYNGTLYSNRIQATSAGLKLVRAKATFPTLCDLINHYSNAQPELPCPLQLNQSWC